MTRLTMSMFASRAAYERAVAAESQTMCMAEAIDLMGDESEKTRRRNRYARRRAKVAKIRGEWS
jgi:hypothetical protein